jgi:putative Mg2+ transporter-C (MgtC) family protein
MSELDWAESALRLLLATVLGGVIGVERQMRNKSAGVRTHMMVALGAALFLLVSVDLPRRMGANLADPARIAAQIVAGVGFLGAGAILHSRGFVVGLTTAASIWLAAAIGMAAGAEMVAVAVTGTVLGVAVLVASHLIERSPIRSDERVTRVQFVVSGENELRESQRRIRKAGGEIVRSRFAPRDENRIEVTLETLLTTEDQTELLASLRQIEGLRDVRIEG